MASLPIARRTTLFVISAAISGILWQCSGEADHKQSAAGKKPGPTGPPRVGAMVLQPGPFSETLSLTGSVLPNEQVQILSEIGGRVTAVRFQEGTRVGAGQVLIKLDDAELVAQLHKADRQTALDADRLRRYLELRKVDGISQEELDAATAQVDVRNAEIEELKARLAKTEIRAPFGGKAGLRAISLGAVISPQTAITTVSDESGLKLEFSVPERFAQAVRAGSTVNFTVRGNSTGGVQKATVYATEPALDVQTRSIRVRARMPQTTAVIPGMFADIQLPLTDTPDALLIPTDAVQQSMKGATVFVAHGGKAQEVVVQLGGRSATHVHVLSGLAAGDTVVVSGQLSLKNGVPVKAEVR